MHYDDYYAEALEMLTDIDAVPFSDPATEGLHHEINVLEKKYNPRLADGSAKFSEAYKNHDWAGAHAALNEIENTVKEWKTDLSNIPPEKRGERALRVTMKIAVIIAGIALIVASPTIARRIISCFQKIGGTTQLGAQVKQAFATIAKRIPKVAKDAYHTIQNPTSTNGVGLGAAVKSSAKTAAKNLTSPKYLAKTAITGKVADTGTKMIKKAVVEFIGGPSKVAQITYGGDANGKDKAYVAAHASLDFWLHTCKELHAEVDTMAKSYHAIEAMTYSNQLILQDSSFDYMEGEYEFSNAIKNGDYDSAKKAVEKVQAAIDSARRELRCVPADTTADKIGTAIWEIIARAFAVMWVVLYNSNPFTAFTWKTSRSYNAIGTICNKTIEGMLNLNSALLAWAGNAHLKRVFVKPKTDIPLVVKTIYRNSPNLGNEDFVTAAIAVEQLAYELSCMKTLLTKIQTERK